MSRPKTPSESPKSPPAKKHTVDLDLHEASDDLRADSQKGHIQWYPGHIAKLRRQLTETLNLVDILIVVLDARLPHASFNQDVLGPLLNKNKPGLLLLNKADLADSGVTSRWRTHYQQQGWTVLEYNSKQGKPQLILNTLLKLGETTWQKLEAKGLRRRPLRAGIIGMPNVGKSSLMNSLLRQKKAQTGDKAGVTRQIRWVRVNPNLELMDTPGLIPPQLDDQAAASLLAAVYSVGENAFDPIRIAQHALDTCAPHYVSRLKTHYHLSRTDALDVESIAIARGMKQSESEADLPRAAHAILKDIRHGNWGPISFEHPKESDEPHP